MTLRGMDWRARRIVCGTDADGLSMIVNDGQAPWVERAGGSILMEIWRMPTLPPAIDDEDALDGNLGAAPPAGGAIIRLCTFPPESEMDLDAFEEAMAQTYGRQPSGEGQTAVRGMHRTATVDVATLLSGELYVVLDKGETIMRPGDSLVQRGTAHAWSNRSDNPAILVVVMVDAKQN